MKKIKLFCAVMSLVLVSAFSSVTALAEEESVSKSQKAVAESVKESDSKAGAFKYEHDPRTNVRAMQDIIVNKKAIYGFSPDPESTRLGDYASYDWTDPVVVEKARQDRIEYLKQFDSMYDLWAKLNREGKDIEEMARAVSKRRNEIRLESYKDDPTGLAKTKASNLKTYGNEDGPTPESLYEKYGSWETVLLKSFSSNSGMDACLGLYDDEYVDNLLTEVIVEIDPVVYTVKKGDTLSKVANKFYGSFDEWNKIYKANKKQISNPSVIYVGQKLVIPID